MRQGLQSRRDGVRAGYTVKQTHCLLVTTVLGVGVGSDEDAQRPPEAPWTPCAPFPQNSLQPRHMERYSIRLTHP